MSDIEETVAIDEIVVDTNDDSESGTGLPTKSLQKVKKPRSEAQIKAFEKAKLKRAENFELRKQEKLLKLNLSKKEKLESKIKEIDNTSALGGLDGQSPTLSDSSGEIIQKEELDCDILGSRTASSVALRCKESKPIELDKTQSIRQERKRVVKPKKPVKKTYVYESDSSETEEEIIVVKKKPTSVKKKPVKKKVVYESESEESEEEVVYESPNVRNRKLTYSDVFKFR